jgi:hypothetical protein
MWSTGARMNFHGTIAANRQELQSLTGSVKIDQILYEQCSLPIDKPHGRHRRPAQRSGIPVHSEGIASGTGTSL